MKKSRSWLNLLILLAVALAGCAPAPTSAVPPIAAPAATATAQPPTTPKDATSGLIRPSALGPLQE